MSSGTPFVSTALPAAANFIIASNMVAATTWLLYDICITMDDEVNLIWSQPRSLTNFVYFVVRYLPLMMELSTFPTGATMPRGLIYPPRACLIWQLYQFTCMMIIFMSVEYILLLRVEALYDGNRIITRIIRSLYVVEVVCMGVGIGISARDFEFDNTCSPSNVPPSSILFGVVTPVFQSTLFALTSVKFVQAIRHGWGRIPLAELIMRDGTWAFLLIEAILCGNGGIFLASQFSYLALLSNWLNSVFSFVGYRVILNLRRVKLAPQESRVDDSASSGNIDFVFGDDSFRSEDFV